MFISSSTTHAANSTDCAHPVVLRAIRRFHLFEAAYRRQHAEQHHARDNRADHEMHARVEHSSSSAAGKRRIITEPIHHNREHSARLSYGSSREALLRSLCQREENRRFIDIQSYHPTDTTSQELRRKMIWQKSPKLSRKKKSFDLEREGGQFAGRLLQLCRFHAKRAVLFCSSIARCQNTQQIVCKATNKHGARTEKKAGGQKKLDCATAEFASHPAIRES